MTFFELLISKRVSKANVPEKIWVVCQAAGDWGLCSVRKPQGHRGLALTNPAIAIGKKGLTSC